VEDDEGWQAELDKLSELLADEEPDNDAMSAVWAWFEDHYPAYMKVIPAGRRMQIVQGVYRARDDEIISLNV
jgi:hypothetical protein